MAPTRFGKYEVREPLGQGGFGTVYLGHDPHLKRQVAIKTCTSSDPDLRRRFVREAELAASLRHPHITTVFDFGEQDGEPYLVQEYLPGEDLSAKIARRERLSPERKLRYLLEVAQALEYAHSRGVVHRDIKPGNIRVLDDDQVKIMDFGIAKLLQAESQLTRTGMTMGTAGYLPPEQIRGQAVDQRADIFSFGVLAYELLTYRRPFGGDDISAVFFRILNEEPRPVADFLPSCPQELAGLVRRCLEKEPADRYQSLGPLIADLEGIAASPWHEVTGEALVPPPSARHSTSGSGHSLGSGFASGRRTTLKDGFEGSTFLTGLRLRRLSLLWLGLSIGGVALALAGLWSLTNWLRERNVESELARKAAAVRPVDATSSAPPPLPPPAPPGQAAEERQASAERPSDKPLRSSAERQRVAGPPVKAPARAEVRSTAGPHVTATAPSQPDLGRDRALPLPEPAPPQPEPFSPPAPEPEPLPASEPSLRPRLQPRRVLVILAGAAEAGVETAEGALLRELAAAGVETASVGFLSPGQRDSLVAGTPFDLASLGRQHAADLVVAGRLLSEAEPSLSRFYVGRAVLDLRIYEAATGRQLGAETVQVGGDGKQGKAGASAMAARMAAAQEAGRLAASRVARTGRLTSSGTPRLGRDPIHSQLV